MSRAREFADLAGSADAGGITGKNLVINGSFAVSQRATSVTGVTGDGYQAVDRWRTNSGSLGTFTLSQSTDAPDGFATSHKYDCTTADASPAAGDFLIFEQRVEAQDLQQLKYGTSSPNKVTLSFYVKSNKTGTYIAELALPDASNNSNNQQSYTINSANTWERKTLTYVGNTTDAINNDTGVGMNVFFWLGAGSTYSGGTLTQNTWANTSAANRAVGQVNIADSTSNEWLITGVQLEVGEQATPFDYSESYGETLAKCQRYYFRTTGSSTGYGNLATVSRIGNTLYRGVVEFPVTMRSRPSFSSSGSFQTLDSGFTFSSMSGGDGASFDSHGVQVTMTSNGSAGQSTLLRQAADGQAALIYDAEL
jgi:hypothetical protein